MRAFLFASPHCVTYNKRPNQAAVVSIPNFHSRVLRPGVNHATAAPFDAGNSLGVLSHTKEDLAPNHIPHSCRAVLRLSGEEEKSMRRGLRR